MQVIDATNSPSEPAKKNIVIFGGGTLFHVKNHLALVAPAYGGTARKLQNLIKNDSRFSNFTVEMQLTKMAGGNHLETNDDIEAVCRSVIKDPLTKIVIMSAALCDYVAEGYRINYNSSTSSSIGKYAGRFSTSVQHYVSLDLKPSKKIIKAIRQERKDIFLVGFKTTCGKAPDDQYREALYLCKSASCNLVFANDTRTGYHMIVTPEEARYSETKDRNEALLELLNIIYLRSQLTFTRSTVVDGCPVDWLSPDVPKTLREVVDFCIQRNAYKPFNGVTAGHFAVKLDDTTFLSSIRKTNFQNLKNIGLVKIKTDGPDTVLAYGSKPSVGGQSQRIVFKDHPGFDCIVHFHCLLKDDAKDDIPIISQKEYECGSHQCGENTSKGLKQFGNIKAVYLNNHGPNIVFNKETSSKEVIDFIEANFDLSSKTGGLVS